MAHAPAFRLEKTRVLPLVVRSKSVHMACRHSGAPQWLLELKKKRARRFPRTSSPEIEPPKETRDGRPAQMMPNRSVYRDLGLHSRACCGCVGGFPGAPAKTFTVADFRIMLSMESGRSLSGPRLWPLGGGFHRNPCASGNSGSHIQIRYPKLINGIEDHSFRQYHSKGLG